MVTCPTCGQLATEGPHSPAHGTERARRFQYSRTGAWYYTCPTHGWFSVRQETVDGERHSVAVIRRDESHGWYLVD